MATIPSEIDEVYGKLKTEITWMHGRWMVYRQLFAESEKRIDLLNESAPTFFYIIQDVLLGEIQVSLSKLTDPARSGKFDNLSLEQLQMRVKANGQPQLAARLRQLLDELQLKCEPFRARRNKQLAHLDLTTAMESSLNPLPGISRQMIEEALKLVRECMNEIERHYCENTIFYEEFIMQSDGEALVSMLKYGRRYKELLQARTIPFDDWREGNWSDA